MKVAIISLIYGNRPKDIAIENLRICGYENTVHTEINREGIAHALNDGIDFMKDNECGAVAFIANDIVEPQDWLKIKLSALIEYPNAGIVASSLDYNRTEILNELIISNYLMSRDVINVCGYFQEAMFPYGPIDLDYCERAWAAGFKTYYVKNCLANHIGSHAIGNEYGWSKDEAVAAGLEKMYKPGKPIKLERT